MKKIALIKSSNQNGLPVSALIKVAFSNAEVGIFWVRKNNTLLGVSEPVEDSLNYGGFATYSNDHIRVWKKLKNDINAPKSWRYSEYEEVPRGRVVFDLKKKAFVIYGPSHLVGDAAFKKNALSYFNIPASSASFKSDPHYEMSTEEDDEDWDNL